MLARLEIPADSLPLNDYIVVLFETEPNGRDVERYGYFLRMRGR